MCTITFIPKSDGYAVAMNRDEKLARIEALPPSIRYVAECRVLCPSEPGGGTWIAVNERGAALGLINWYAVPSRVPADAVSRGQVVAAVAGVHESESVARLLSKLPLKQINPFRLVGVFPESHTIFEWRWNLNELKCACRDWAAQQWISSGFDEPMAERARSETFRRACKATNAGSREWLRQLHQSHTHGPGPFSICMHRADAASVSYTEVSVSSGQARMRYGAGSPCHPTTKFQSQLERVGSPLRHSDISTNFEPERTSARKADHVNRLVTAL